MNDVEDAVKRALFGIIAVIISGFLLFVANEVLKHSTPVGGVMMIAGVIGAVGSLFALWSGVKGVWRHG